MNLAQLSEQYRDSAVLLSGRMSKLRAQLRDSENEQTRQHLRRRMADLTPMLRQCRDLQALTAHYYDRGFHRDGKYTV